jgi:hypothetical protein
MRSVALLVGFTLAIAVCGCAKKSKSTGKSEDTAAITPSQPAVEKAQAKAKPAEKTDKPAEKKNWVGDPRYKPKSDPADPDLPPDGLPPSKQPWVGQPPAGAGDAKLPAPKAGGNEPGKAQPGPMGVLQPQPVPQPAPAKQSSPPAAASRVTKEDMENVWIFIENFSLASGKMPPPNLVYAALVEAKSPAAALVKDGSIVLTGATTRESVWAFEKNAATQGGMIVTQNKVETVTAAEFARRVTGR